MTARCVYVILDANVLMHFTPPDQFDWRSICGGADVRLVVYPLLLTELSNAKDMHPVKHLRQRAGDRGVWLRDRLARPEDEIRPGVRLHKDPQDAREILTELRLDPAIKDDGIIALAVRYRREGLEVSVATADGGLEMKLEYHGVTVIVPDDSLRLQPEPDPERLRAERLDREIRALRDRLPNFVVSWEEQASVKRPAGYGDMETYVRSRLEATEASYQARQNGRNQRPLDSIFNPRHVSDLQLASAFLRVQHAWLTKVEGAARFRLSVQNIGSRTATEVRIQMFAPPDLRPHRGFGIPPSRGSYISEPFLGLPVEAGAVNPTMISYEGAGDGLPRVDGSSKIAAFEWSRIQHQALACSGAFWFTASPAIASGRQPVRVEVLCEELGEPKVSILHVDVAEDGLAIG